MKGKNRKGFTLVELIVVLAIMGIVAAILVPTMFNYIKRQQQRPIWQTAGRYTIL